MCPAPGEMWVSPQREVYRGLLEGIVRAPTTAVRAVRVRATAFLLPGHLLTPIVCSQGPEFRHELRIQGWEQREGAG